MDGNTIAQPAAAQPAAPVTTPATDLNNIIASYNAATDPNGAAASPDGAHTDTAPATPATPDPATQTTTQQEPAQNPANAAFAQMRAENAKLKQIMQAYAATNGLEANEDTILAQLNQQALAKQAKDLNVPPEVLAQLKQQQDMIDAILARDVKNRLATEFGNLQTTYGLTNDQAGAFAQQLNDGKFNLDDLSKLDVYYKGLNFDTLVQAAVDKALSDANATSTYAAQHSATVVPIAGAATTPAGTDSTADTLAMIKAGIAQL